MNLNLQAGVMIIGSLYWDGVENDDPKQRWQWRKNRLLLDKSIHVTAPIRYGRLSENGAYTMVFSKDCDNTQQLGTAYVVPFSSNPVADFNALLLEGQALSKAEGSANNKLVKGRNDKWCTIGLLFNPALEKTKKQFILAEWKKILEEQNGNENELASYKVGSEVSVLSPSAEILIDWPKPVNANKQDDLSSLDVIIATCTKPNVPTYPTPDEVKSKLVNDDRNYFFNNIKQGITTFQDRQILGEDNPTEATPQKRISLFLVFILCLVLIAAITLIGIAIS